MPGHHRLHRAQFVGAKPKIARQLGWVEPELSRQVVAIDLNVRRFARFVALKIEPVRAGPEHSRHARILPNSQLKSPIIVGAKVSPEIV